MMRFKYLIVIVAGILLTNCADNEEENVEADKSGFTEQKIENLYWLEGTWIDYGTYANRTPPKQIIEKWQIKDGKLIGEGLLGVGEQESLTEKLSIQYVNDTLTYIAEPVGKSLISFPNVPIKTKDAWVFENLANDFPQSVIYYKPVGDTMTIVMKGLVEVGEVSKTFKFVKSN